MIQLTSQVIITSNIDESIEMLEKLQTTERIIKIREDEKIFSVDDAKEVIAKAYIASDELTVIILGAKIFSPIVQNKLLKIVEEPPKNKAFIFVTNSKSTILDTIRSRLPIITIADTSEKEILELDLVQLSLESAYTFIQKHKRTNAKDMTKVIEEIAKEAIFTQKYNLDNKTLTLFHNAYVALDMGSPPQFILNTLLLKLLAKKTIIYN